MDDNALLLSFALGGVGFVLFVYGKRQGRVPQMLAGLILLVFPYFVSSLLLMAGIAAGVLLLLWGMLRLGA
jgi:hypothetical protein